MDKFKHRTQKDIEYDISTETKLCRTCGERKEFSKFKKAPISKYVDGYLNLCKECYNVIQKERRSKEPYKEREKYYRKKQHLKEKFNLSIEDFEILKEKQNNTCAICGEKNNRFLSGIRSELCVDHNHSTGEIRELLCHYCNTGLGKFKDSKILLEKALKYLDKHGK